MQQKNSVDQKHQEKTEKPINCSRRKALKTIAAGTAAAGTMALAGKWSKPVVDTIILPAHAQATNPTGPTATTTPAATTTNGECSPVLDWDRTCVQVVRDPQTNYVTSVNVVGSVIPAQAGVAITAEYRTYSPTNPNASQIYTFQTTTNASGAFSVDRSFSIADQITEISAGAAGGPCGGNDISTCAPRQE
jgi:hypothetical protein